MGCQYIQPSVWGLTSRSESLNRELFLPKETIPTWEYSSHKRTRGMDCVWVTAYLQITVLRSTGLCKPVQKNGSWVELELLGS